MPTPILQYRSVQRASSVQSAEGITITMRSEACWKREDHADKKFKEILTVTGELEEKGQKYPVEWEFDFPTGSWQVLNESISLFDSDDNQSINPPIFPRELYVEVFDWLRVGHVQSKDGSFSYCEFTKSKGSPKIRATFTGLPTLSEVREMLFPFFV